MEATTNTWEVADLTLHHVAKLAIADPHKLRDRISRWRIATIPSQWVIVVLYRYDKLEDDSSKTLSIQSFEPPSSFQNQRTEHLEHHGKAEGPGLLKDQ